MIVFDGTSIRIVPIGADKVVPENFGSHAASPMFDSSAAPRSPPASCASEAFESAVDDWLVLMAGAQAGMSQRSLDIGVEYVGEREAFGQKIGGVPGRRPPHGRLQGGDRWRRAHRP